MNEFNDVFKSPSLALRPLPPTDNVEPSKSIDNAEPPPPVKPLPAADEAILKFSEPSASKPVPAKSDTSIFNVISEAESPLWL